MASTTSSLRIEPGPLPIEMTGSPSSPCSTTARGLGASSARILTTIYLPLTLRGIVAGVTLVFVVSLGFYITPALLGGGKVMMYAMVIEQQVREFLAWNFAGALSVILLAVTLAMFWLLNQGVARHLKD